jgi:hypothetical protein
MKKTKDEIVNDIRTIFASLNSGMTSARLASSAYNILDLIIQLNSIEPGSCRKEILDLSRTLDKELSYTHEIAKDIYIKNVAFVTEEELIMSKNNVINKIKLDISLLL